MHHMETAEEKYIKMTEAPIKGLVVSLAIPTILSMLVTSVYNMADTFFVGQIGAGSIDATSAAGAVGVAYPLMMLIQAVGFTLGMGSGNYISRLLGAKNRDFAENVASTAFFTAFACGLFFMIIGLAFLDKLIYFLGSTDTIAPYAKSYAGYILIGMPYMAASFVLNNLLRYQGNAFYAMIGIMTGGVLNIILDPIFIFVLDMGVSGAALATIISQLISFSILLLQCYRGDHIRIRLSSYRFDLSMYKTILTGGMPSFFRQGLASVATILLNSAARGFGDAAITAMSVATKVFMFALSSLIGFGQGFQPVCGFNFGAKKYDRVLEAFWFCVKTAVCVLIVIGILGAVFSTDIVTQFRKNDLAVIEIGSLALRLQFIFFPLSAWTIMTNMLMQTIGESRKTSILALARQGIFFIPCILILPHFLEILGLQLSQPIADVASFMLAIYFGRQVLKDLNKKRDEQLQAVNDESQDHA